ncbi:MAG: isoprenylcysteine carboxylmethyltransferase family protein [Candidatus Hydrogenedentes bacterium]|nr:isoprenylcysteine carboxylmethyltransferase family protein [Candidatus Hydrogenedentota bacterium]MBI3117627.1 isoprenylcysteine carboxylmethyltransferase family protein [Candidatus Hydrogenedentota bacterium]
MMNRFECAYRWRGVLMAPPYLALILVTLAETEHDAIVWPLGMGVFAAGVGLRIWAQMHLHYRLRVRKKLTTTGPYARVRNPIYIANTTMLLGLTFMSEVLWFLPVMLLWCMAVYSLVVRREEAHLSEKYGEPYRQFLRDVPRWLPRFSLRPGLATDARSFLWPSVLAELHCLLWLVPLLGKELFRSLY